MLGLGFALPVIEFVRLHPYQYTHFNHIAGGVPGADGRYMRDYWGLSFRQAGEALRATLAERRRDAARTAVAHRGVRPASAGAGRARARTSCRTWDPKGADFALMLGEFYCARLDAPVLVEIAREGVVYARAYDIRGRTIPSLFTLPPVE